MNKGIKIGINLILVLLALGLAYKLYNSIMTPIKFKQSFEYRSEIVKDKMIKIREAEIAYLYTYQKYTSDFDTLIDFIKNDSLLIPKSTGVVPDSIYNTSTSRKEAEQRAIDLGIITRDTLKVAVKDSLFRHYNVDTLAYVPFTNLSETFQLNATIIKTLSNATRPVFELKVHNNSFTHGLDEQQIINVNDAARDNDEFPGYLIGSMSEVTTAGNWD
ncbi:MAG: hypothetical protein JXR68_03400 [Bacteroidales bacterium]|nr:hypothetical protein [Bacteroidales bacterium]